MAHCSLSQLCSFLNTSFHINRIRVRTLPVNKILFNFNSLPNFANSSICFFKIDLGAYLNNSLLIGSCKSPIIMNDLVFIHGISLIVFKSGLRTNSTEFKEGFIILPFLIKAYITMSEFKTLEETIKPSCTVFLIIYKLLR